MDHTSPEQRRGLLNGLANCTKPLPSPFNTPRPAAYLAVQDTPSPLEQLVSASHLLSGTRPSWEIDLPFRFLEPHTIAGLDNDTSNDDELPLTPPVVAVSRADDEDLTPRPLRPLLPPPTWFDGSSPGSSSREQEQTAIPAPESESSRSPSHGGLVRRGAVHRHRASIELLGPADHTERRGRDASRPQAQSPSSPIDVPQPSSLISRSPAREQRPGADSMSDPQKARFFRALARANGGTLPQDAERRWTSVRDQLSPRRLYAETERTRNWPSRAGDDGLDIPRPAHIPLFPRSGGPSSSRNSLRPQNIQLAITRGGRPLTDLSAMAPPQRMPVYSSAAAAHRNSEQENVDDEAWERFDAERRMRLRRVDIRARGESGYRADEEDNDDEGTPPPLGRLERML
ncbi:MAG: hypothetical protein Q9162_002361 [Coniocarpon cinnabarinum]